MPNKEKTHIVYKNKTGDVLPGVTTVIGLLAKPALIHWAWKLGTEGIDYRKAREKAQNIGTIAHYLIHCEIKGKKPDTSEYPPKLVDKAETAFLAWLEWRDKFDLKTVGSELPLVSEIYGYGGTLDWVAINKNDLWLVDFKTSKNKQVYDEHRYQLAAYKSLWDENHHGQEIKNSHLLMIDKEDGGFAHHELPNLDREFSIFEHLLEVYKLRKK